MGKKCLITSFLIFLGAFTASSVYGQDALDVLRYSLEYPSYDPVTLVMPGVAAPTGFGAYQENPAVMAMFDQSYFSAGLSGRFVREEATYLGNTTSFSDNQINIGNIGFVYNLPTTRGKLTIGGGYSQTHDFNRAFAGNAYNELTTITDSYADLSTSNPLNEAAYSAYAIYDPNGGVASRSVLRFPGFSSYQGIGQDFEQIEEGTMGEYSFFAATEFQENFFVGVSIGVISGNYSYRREFLETDSRGVYSGNTWDTNDDGRADSDIDNISETYEINATFAAFSLRFGAAYQVTPHINIGASYQFKNTLSIDEKYDTYITTTFDNGVSYTGDDLGRFEYKITRPARLKAGITAKDLSGFTISVAAERVDYSTARIEFESAEDQEFERGENNFIESSYEDVINLRIGLQYAADERFTPRIGFGYYPDPLGGFEEGSGLNANRRIYSAGFTAQLSERTELNVGAQLATWDDRYNLYSAPIDGEYVTESVIETIYHWHIMAGLRVYF